MFEDSGFTPHGFCLQWQPLILWADALADGLMTLAYFSIPALLFLFAWRRPDFRAKGLACLFASFITLCGLTHILDVVTLWQPYYALQAATNLLAALASVLSAGTLWAVAPKLLRMPSPQQLAATNGLLSAEIADRIRAETALQQLNNALESRVQQRSLELSTALAQAEAATRAEAAFLAMTGHHLRTPLNAMLGFTDLAQSHAGDPLCPAYLDEVRRGGLLLLDIVNQALEFSTAEAGLIEFAKEIIDPGILARDCLHQMLEPAQKKGLILAQSLTAALTTPYLGDSARIRLILRTLLTNAVKFTEQGEVRLDLEIDAGPSGQDVLHFRVADTGIGIAADDLERVFEPFTSLSRPHNGVGSGVGLGLSIARRFARAMGGEIRVTSSLGHGSCFDFVVSLPRTAETALPLSLKGAGHVLLAEDNDINALLVQELMAGSKVSCDRVVDGRAAIAAVQHSRYDLVLMDIQMPAMDGIDATRAIRALPAPDGKIPIIALTANTMPADQQRYRSVGINEVIAKPISKAALFSTLDRYIPPA